MRDEVPKQEICFENAQTLVEHLIASMPRRNQDRLHIRFHAGGGIVKRADILPYDAPVEPTEPKGEGTLHRICELLKELSCEKFFGSASVYLRRVDEIVSVHRIEYYPFYKLDLTAEQLVQQFS